MREYQFIAEIVEPTLEELEHPEADPVSIDNPPPEINYDDAAEINYDDAERCPRCGRASIEYGYGLAAGHKGVGVYQFCSSCRWIGDFWEDKS